MNKFEQYRKAASVVRSVSSTNQLESMVAYINLFRKQVKDSDMGTELRKEGLRSIDKLQAKAGLQDLILLRDYINKV